MVPPCCPVETATIRQLQAALLPAIPDCLSDSIGWMKASRSLIKSVDVLLISEFIDMPGTHHHSLQHKQVSQLAGESDSPEATSPYSRTPALRNSHKMAERKRRTEMKTLFDALRAQIPASHGSKSSKWEILSKGIFHGSNRPLPYD